MKLDEFEKELKALDPMLGIRPNPAHKVFPELEKLAAVTYGGEDLFTIPNHEIFDDRIQSYGRGDGRFIVHRTRIEALEGVKEKLKQLQDKDYADAFFGRGEYSEAALRSVSTKGDIELVEEVSSEVTEFSDTKPITPKEIL